LRIDKCKIEEVGIFGNADGVGGKYTREDLDSAGCRRTAATAATAAAATAQWKGKVRMHVLETIRRDVTSKLGNARRERTEEWRYT
jgi:hypothetical protein